MKKTLLIASTLVFGLLCTAQVSSQSKSNRSDSQANSKIARDNADNRPVIIESKPEPEKPDKVSDTPYESTIVLRAVFRKNGKITDIKFIEAKPTGFLDAALSKKAIAAVKKIKFKPAMKDGHPVSMLMQLEYNFKLN